MSIPVDINDRLEAAALKAEGGSEIIRRFANEPEGVELTTESGVLPSLKEWLKQRDAEIGGIPALKQRVTDIELDASGLLATPTGGGAVAPLSDIARDAVRGSVIFSKFKNAYHVGDWGIEGTDLAAAPINEGVKLAQAVADIAAATGTLLFDARN